MILSDQAILERIKSGDIVIDPFDRDSLGSNSYDVRLSPFLMTYARPGDEPLDPRVGNGIAPFKIDSEGYLLQPGKIYLGSTVEYTETHNLVPFLEGKSSIGRLGISVHATAGKGDAGFCNHWTLELSCIEPVWIYPGMKIAQLIYFCLLGDVQQSYNKKPSAHYTEISKYPQASRSNVGWKSWKEPESPAW